MILEPAITRLQSYRPTLSEGESTEALWVAELAEQQHRDWQESSLGMIGRGVLDQLFEVYEETQAANWDGYGALAVAPETYAFAFRFLDALPLGTPAPSVGAESDGHLTLEWYSGPRRMLSVSLSPTREMHYAAIMGLTKVHGSEPFIGEIPRRLSDYIHSIMRSA